ncbi:hypothetical protein KIKIMORA_05000 [Brevundimonas phage vB_BpoS-Kikimora]|uniref:Uncharacterized protein n=1 Tax=Brevundimonas phage vB_BpoS-Kikimora TaxID=2948601 RepID=A0A9E7MS19_9CAUD|nr:hypothetical protein KIKIMORA_05000 [Brevundimonas phage vB_BpoS-Kikimora]
MYMNASRRSVLILEMAHLWGEVMNMTTADGERSHQKERFDGLAQRHPREAEAAKKLQSAAFDAALAL